jgi:hypothetical protein
LKKKTALLISIILFSTILFAQKNKSSKMGQTTLEELKMTVYAKDSSASAVVLYAHTNRYPDKLKTVAKVKIIKFAFCNGLYFLKDVH